MGVITVAQPHRLRSSDLRLARRALISLRETHGFVPTKSGNCWAHDLVTRWAKLIDAPMPIPVARQELRICMFDEAPDYRTECEHQRRADEELAEGLVYGDIRLVPLRKRGRR